jgi:hypothetical protein
MDEFGEAEVGAIQPDTHSFVVKVWLSGHPQEGDRDGWHGRITHVPTGHHRHFVKMKDMATFMMPYLHRLGVKPTLRWKVQHWFLG